MTAKGRLTSKFLGLFVALVPLTDIRAKDAEMVISKANFLSSFGNKIYKF